MSDLSFLSPVLMPGLQPAIASTMSDSDVSAVSIVGGINNTVSLEIVEPAKKTTAGKGRKRKLKRARSLELIGVGTSSKKLCNDMQQVAADFVEKPVKRGRKPKANGSNATGNVLQSNCDAVVDTICRSFADAEVQTDECSSACPVCDSQKHVRD